MKVRRPVITERQLNQMVDAINMQAGVPPMPYINGAAQVGNYHISHAYGGVALHKMANTGGAVHDVFARGHMPKRELRELMYSFTPQ